MSLSDRDAFLNAIHASPDDDAPRLIFSDWLDENGEVDRAEFIRIQIELIEEYRKHQGTTSRHDALFRRQRELLQLPWADLARTCEAQVITHFDRGFPNYLILTASRFLELDDKLEAWIGPNTLIRLQDCHGSMAKVAGHPRTTSIRRIALDLQSHGENSSLDSNDVISFLHCPFLKNLNEFRFQLAPNESSDYFEDRIIHSIVSASSLSALRSLDLSSIRISAKGAKLLATAPSLATLRTLNLSHSGLTRSALKAISNSKYLKGLTTLNLEFSATHPEDLDRLRNAFAEGVVQSNYGMGR